MSFVPMARVTLELALRKEFDYQLSDPAPGNLKSWAPAFLPMQHNQLLLPNAGCSDARRGGGGSDLGRLYSPEYAQDLTQEFFARWLGKRGLEKVDPGHFGRRLSVINGRPAASASTFWSASKDRKASAATSRARAT